MARTWGDSPGDEPRHPQYGGQTPAPLNAPPTSPLGYGVQPGSIAGIIVARLVEIFGPNSGIFLYNPVPGAGNLTESGAAVGGTDQFGNPYIPGWAAYGTNSTAVAIQSAAGIPAILFLSGAASEVNSSRIITEVFNRGLVNEQIATFFEGPQSSASPTDRVIIDLFDSGANNPGVATGEFEYDQAAGTPPAFVQSAQGTSSGATTTTVTLGANTTVGNTLVVTVQGDSTSGPDPAVSGITLGGGADHFASVVVASGAVTRTECWYDPNIGTASTAVVVTTSAATGARVNVTVAEFSGLLTPTSVDQTSTNPSGAAGTAYTSNTTPGLGSGSDIAVGIVATEQTGGTINAATGFTMFTQQSNGQAIARSGWQLLTSFLGVAYSGTFASNPGGYSALVATFKPSASASPTRLVSAAWGRQGWGGLLVNKNISTVPASNPAVAETWHTIAPSNSFTAGTPTPQYQYEAMNGGRVRFRGQIVTPTAVAGTTWFTLPVGYRPANGPNTFNCVTNMSGAIASVAAYAGGSIQIATSGACTIVPATTNTDVIWLDGITFPLD